MRKLLSLTLLAGGLGAQAATVAFDNRMDWTAAVTAAGRTVGKADDLGGIVGPGDTAVFPSLTRPGFLITPQGGTQLVVADRDAPGYDFGPRAVVSAELGFPSMLRISFSRPVFAFAFDAGAFPALGDMTDLVVDVKTAAGMQTFKVSGVGGADLSFAGFTSTSRIHSLSISGGPADPVFTNFTANAVPEPSSLVLIGSAGVGILLLRRRRRIE